LFGATIALVCITAYYTRETRNLVRAPYRPSLRPNLVSDPQPNNEYTLKLQIENIGVGIATDIEIEYYIVDSKSGIFNGLMVSLRRILKITTISTQIISLELPLYPIEKSNPETPHRSSLSPLFDIKGLQRISPTTREGYYSQHNVKLKVELECKDLLGKEHSSERDLDVSAKAHNVRFHQ
jgi:hypothetical protein